MSETQLLSRRTLLLAAAALVAAPALAQAGVHKIDGLSIWVPSNWATRTGEDRFEAHSADEVIYLRAQIVDLPQKATLANAPLEDIIDDELDDYSLVNDRMDTTGAKPVRIIEGTGKDEGDDVHFRVVAVPASQPTQVLLAMVYAETAAFQYPANIDTMKHILSSLGS